MCSLLKCLPIMLSVGVDPFSGAQKKKKKKKKKRKKKKKKKKNDEVTSPWKCHHFP